ncbi:MAG: hypothetical protein GX913_01625 [Clostridiales bacterium]|nr:hypothetical protein [Clostridiales bacterium]
MSIAKSVYVPNSYRFSIVYVDSYKNKCLSGRVYHPTYGKAKSFRSLIELLKMMEDLFDNMSYPTASMQIRKFQPEILHIDKESYGNENGVSMHYLERKGKLVTFSVKVQFRRNASWQGRLRWIDKNREEHFRSILEMIMLMDNALSEGESWNSNEKQIEEAPNTDSLEILS